MSSTDFTTRLQVSAAPQKVYDSINDVRSWWADDFRGNSAGTGDEFEVKFRDLHYSKQRLTSARPVEYIEWLVTDSNLSFLEKRDEWTGTKIRFNLVPKNGQTEILFTHEGLKPEVECYGACTRGWAYYLERSLLPYINLGKGKPGFPEY